ncbi:MAG TPA: family 10 glycosylhydrolase [Clostridiaceae bacterium]|nr:family 10 glycosylhydrolase [Clostridiaceae bacterium]
MSEKSIIVNIDPYDNILWSDSNEYTKVMLENTFCNIARAGADTVFWRVTCIGKVFYWSNIEYRHDGGINKNAYKVKNFIEKYDPTELAVEYARKYNLNIYIWMTMYDDFYPGMTSRLIKEHPEFQWVDRSGDVYFKGVVNYCYPEVREYKLAMVKELVNYEADGFYLSMRSHAPHLNVYDIEDMFGYNKPIVEEYEKRYGINILKYNSVKTYRKNKVTWIEYIDDGFDKELWHRLKGEYHTMFIKDVRKVTKEKGQKLIVHVAGDYNGIYPLGQTNKKSARFYTDYRNWVREDVVDGILYIPPVPQTDSKGQPTTWGNEEYDLTQELEYMRYYREAIKDKAKLYMWHHVNVKYNRWDCINTIAREVFEKDQSNLIDGIVLHEAATFEYGRR